MLVGLDDFELLLEKVGPLDVHLFHFFTVATGGIEGGRNGHLTVPVRRKILQKTSETVPSGDHGHAGDVGVNRLKVALGFGGVGKVDDQASCLLSRVALLPFQLVKQALGWLHDPSMA